MRRILAFTLFSLAGAIALFGTTAHAGTEDDVNQILARSDTPFGVVFEIVEGSGKALQWAIPAVNGYVKRLRERFPDIGLAVVSHGNEQFGLMTSQQSEQAQMHQAVQSLVASDVPVHVCGTHASWRGKDAEDFPDYVDVTPAGPTEIRNYEAMGYVLVVVRKP